MLAERGGGLKEENVFVSGKLMVSSECVWKWGQASVNRLNAGRRGQLQSGASGSSMKPLMFDQAGATEYVEAEKSPLLTPFLSLQNASTFEDVSQVSSAYQKTVPVEAGESWSPQKPEMNWKGESPCVGSWEDAEGKACSGNGARSTGT
jgi:hypothetical protein